MKKYKLDVVSNITGGVCESHTFDTEAERDLWVRLNPPDAIVYHHSYEQDVELPEFSWTNFSTLGEAAKYMSTWEDQDLAPIVMSYMDELFIQLLTCDMTVEEAASRTLEALDNRFRY